MKGFNFQEFFTDLFDQENIFGKFMTPASAFEGRHNIKMMYIRKIALNIPSKKSADASPEELPKFIYGVGKGLEPTLKLQYFSKTEEEEDWTTDDEEGGILLLNYLIIIN
jgi:hypothetical protein